MKNTEKKRSKKEWKEDIFKAIQYLKPAIGLVWESDRVAVISMMFLTLIGSILPVSQAYLGLRIVDSVLFSIRNEVGASLALRNIAPILFAEFCLILIGVCVNQWRSYSSNILNQKLGQAVNVKVMHKASVLPLPYFENPEFHEQMKKARDEAEYRATGIMNASFLLTQNILTIISFAITIIALNPWVALLLFGATLPAFLAQAHYSRLNFRLDSWKTEETMRMRYYEILLTWRDYAKEVKLYELAKPLMQQHEETFQRIFGEDQKLAARRSFTAVIWGGFASLSFYACYAWVIWRTAAKIISVGQMTFYLSAFRQLQGTFQGAFENINTLFENGLFMQNLFSFLALPEKKEDASIFLPEPQGPLGVTLKNVSFRYPEQKDWTLRNISLHVNPGEKIAIVGENGAGKTTLIKLITRLYEPTEGEIFLNGINLKDYKEKDLVKKIGAVFQDFMRFNLTARENVGFGSVDHMGEQDRLDESALMGGAREMILGFDDKWDTMLGHWFRKGKELSGGQWQKIALSRAFMRDSEVIILDEPTSALDAAKEYEIFARFKELTEGKTAFLISHRFSTVRMADKIIVIEKGGILESGSHQELMQTKGVYARLFDLQAEGYR